MKRSPNNISIPARISLWLGVFILGVAYFQHELALLIIGSLFICIGCVLWIVFGNFSTLYENGQELVYRILQKTPLKNLQLFYNFEARIEIRRKKYKIVLQNEIQKAELLLKNSTRHK